MVAIHVSIKENVDHFPLFCGFIHPLGSVGNENHIQGAIGIESKTINAFLAVFGKIPFKGVVCTLWKSTWQHQMHNTMTLDFKALSNSSL